MALPTPIAIDATVGGASANSYITLAGAEDYFVSRLWAGSDWQNASDDYKNRALVMATRLLDQWFDWFGVVVSSDQALLWPRSGVVGVNGYLEPTDAIPTRIQQACCEWARQMLISDRTADSDAQAAAISRVVAGPVEVDFNGTATAKPVPDQVAAMVAPYGQMRSKYSSATVELLRS